MDIVGEVPDYLVDTFDVKEWVKSKLRAIDTDNDGVDRDWAQAYVDDYEWVEYQASPIYHYRELQRMFMTFATGQPSMFSTYSTNWAYSYRLDHQGESFPYVTGQEWRNRGYCQPD
jgi:hypothetical protein